MSESLSGKVVLVTGAAKRVGAAIARRLHRDGASLMLHYRASEREARALREELNALRSGSVALLQADLLDVAGLTEIVKNTVGRFERLDALVNNASTFFPTPLGEMTAASWEALVGANLRAPLFLSQAAAPHLKKTGGAIVNITDIHAERPLKNYVIYSIAKTGLVGLTRSLARELAPEVRVNGVARGHRLARGRLLGRGHAPAHRVAHTVAAHRRARRHRARRLLSDRGSTVRHGADHLRGRRKKHQPVSRP